MRTVVLVLVVVPAFAGIFAVRQRDEARHRAELAELRALIPEVRTAEPRVVYNLLASAAQTEPRRPEPPAAASGRAESDALAADEPPVSVEELGTEFDASPRDSGALRVRQTTLTTETSAALPPSSRLASLECRAKLCRVETEHPDRTALERFVDTWLLHPEVPRVPGPVFFSPPEPDRAGKLKSVAFVLEPEGQ
jgi:hypothetical protein